MLRRYNSQNLDTIVLKTRRTTIGSAPNCDVVIKGNGIAPIHASIEANSSGFWLHEHSLAEITKVNDQPVAGQTQIQSGDLIQIGKNAPFVFESQWLAGTRPNSSKMPAKIPEQETILPILGKKISPLPQNGRSSSIKRNYSRSADQFMRSSASSTESSAGHYKGSSGKSIGNNLLQRVVKLQSELIDRDEKIRQLMSSSSSSSDLYRYQTLQHAQPPLQMMRPRLESFSKPKIDPKKSFELLVYRGFVSAIASQLRMFNDRALRNPQREYAEIFTSIVRACDVPLKNRIKDIEKDIENVLIDNDFEDNNELFVRLDHFLRESRKEKVLELTNELETILPIIRDAASNARDNIKVCSVFTQWSRQFGDRIQTSSFSSSVLFQAIEDLNRSFSEAHMSRHWLPPSIIPILRTAALEIEKIQEGNVIKNEKEFKGIHRKNSIDGSLDSCISQVEALEHELCYHISRLEMKAKDYGIFKLLDEKTRNRIETLVKNIDKSIEKLDEFSRNRKTSLISFEVTEKDIEKELKRSDSESPVRKISTLSSEKLSKMAGDKEDVNRDSEVEIEIRKLISENDSMFPCDLTNIGDDTVRINYDILKAFIKQSKELRIKFEDLNKIENVTENRTKRSVPEEQSSIIVVDSKHIEAEEKHEDQTNDNNELKENQNDENEQGSLENVPEVEETKNDEETVIHHADLEHEGPERIYEGGPEVANSEIDDEGHYGQKDDEDLKEDKKHNIHLDPDDHESDHRDEHDGYDSHEDHDDQDDNENHEDYEDHVEGHDDHDDHAEDVEKKEHDQEHSNEEGPSESEHHDSRTPIVETPAEEHKISNEENIEKSAPIASEQIEPIEIISENKKENEKENKFEVASTPAETVSEPSMRLSNSETVSSHLRSHMNTANGKPNVVYQYPVLRRYYSPPMKRRSKSEEKKVKEKFDNRPPFVLY